MPTKTLYEIDLHYNQKFTQSQLLAFQKYFPEAKFKQISDFGVPSYTKKEEKYITWTEEDFESFQKKEYEKYLSHERKELSYFSFIDKYIDLEQFLIDCPNIPIIIQKRQEISFTHFEPAFSFLEYQSMFKTLEKLSHQLENRNSFSEHTQVHINGNHLMSINDLMLCEDACTDNIQSHLNNGWKIIAVCAQDARRPDYVLGRFNDGIKSLTAQRG